MGKLHQVNSLYVLTLVIPMNILKIHFYFCFLFNEIKMINIKSYCRNQNFMERLYFSTVIFFLFKSYVKAPKN